MTRKARFTGAVLVAAIFATGACSTSVQKGPCPTGLRDCEGTCRDTRGDFNNCGACGQTCPATNMSCMEGTCTEYCGEAAAATDAQIASLIRGEGWESVGGTIKVIRVSGSVELDASLVGAGGMFRFGGGPIAGITLDSPVQYGFDMSVSQTCCNSLYDMIYPQTGYGTAVFDDVSFTAETETVAGGMSSICAGEACVEWRFSSSMQCITPMACCCAADPIQWTIITVSPVPQACSVPAPCASGYIGMNPSICYDDYASYIEGQAHVHGDCVDPTGHITSGKSCTCMVGWDYIRPVEGECDDDGVCDVEMPGDSPPVAGCR